MKDYAITATLKNAYWEQGGNTTHPQLAGEIHDDARKRWPDGTKIWSSTVQKHLGENVFRTRNSIYRVEFKEEYPMPDALK